MGYVFLTACRNEQAILDEFLREFTEAVREAGLGTSSVLYVVDDLSTDRSVEVMERYQQTVGGVPLRIVRAPTNLGNQGALFYGLSQIEVAPGDTLITFDCDGEDDVRQIPSIIALGKENPEKLVLIERGRRQESLTFRVAFTCYKVLFRFLTRQTVVPNNFLLIPGQYVPFLRRTPLAAVHFAYAILKTRFPSVSTQRDRRPRYGGRSSQSLFMVASHGLVGLMVFYETVIAKLLLLLMTVVLFSLGVVGAALALPQDLGIQRSLLWTGVAIAGVGAGFFSLMMSSALALILKMAVFTLSWVGAEGRAGPTLPPPRDASEPGVVPAGKAGRQAS